MRLTVPAARAWWIGISSAYQIIIPRLPATFPVNLIPLPGCLLIKPSIHLLGLSTTYSRYRLEVRPIADPTTLLPARLAVGKCNVPVNAASMDMICSRRFLACTYLGILKWLPTRGRTRRPRSTTLTQRRRLVTLYTKTFFLELFLGTCISA